MQIYIAHSREFDFQNELYTPIQQSHLSDLHEIILPHKNSTEPYDSKSFFQHNCDLLIAEVSFPSIGLGIELGWANIYSVPILSIYRSGIEISNSVKGISQELIEYTDADDLINQIDQFLVDFKSDTT